VQVALCTEYAKKNFAGASPKAAEQYFRSAVMEHSIASNTMPEDGIQRDLDKYGKMRYSYARHTWHVDPRDQHLLTLWFDCAMQKLVIVCRWRCPCRVLACMCFQRRPKPSCSCVFVLSMPGIF